MDELQALCEMSQVVSSMLDLETGSTIITGQSVLLSRADEGTIFDYDDSRQSLLPTVNLGISRNYEDMMQEVTLARGEWPL